MRVKKVNRYWCDFCKKAGCSGGHIKRHEERCTLNPNRVCGMCNMLEQEQSAIAVLVALLPNPDVHKQIVTDDRGREIWHTWNGLDEAMKTALPALREAAGNCPACILAALRQAKIPVPEVTGFKFTDECKLIWSGINEDAYQRENVHY